MLAGATPISIGESIPDKAQGSGFLSRVILVWASSCNKPMNPLTDLDDEDIDQGEIDKIKCVEVSLIAELQRMAQIRGPFKYTRDGRLWFKDWLSQWNNSPQGQTEGARRRQDHLLRLSMILNISDNIKNLDISDPLLRMHTDLTLFKADFLLQKVELNVPMALSHVGRTPASRNYDRIIELIRTKGGRLDSDSIKRRMHQFYPNISDLIQALESLRQAKMIIYLGVEKATSLEWWRLP